MKKNKEEYEKKLDILARYCSDTKTGIFPPRIELYDELYVFDSLIKEHFELVEHAKKLQDELDKYKHEYFSMCDLLENHQPYKFEDLKPSMFVFDCIKNRINKIIEIFEHDFGIPYIKFDDGFGEWFIVEFKEGRFYPITKALCNGI